MRITVFIFVTAALAYAQPACAAHTTFPQFTDFNTAWDTYVPDGHPFDNPSLVYGAPPDLGTYNGTYGPTSAGWFDGRNGSNGIMARYPSGTPYDGIGGSGTPITSSGAGYGVQWATPGGYGYGLGDMAFGRPSKRDTGPNAGLTLGGTNLGQLASWSFLADIYLTEGGAVVSGANGSPNSHNRSDGYNPDFWWTNAIGDSTTGSYATETGIAGKHDTPGTWSFTTTGGGPIVSGLASGQWITMEVRYDFTGTNLAAIHNVWTQNHNTLLGSYTIPAGSMFLNPTSAGSQGGPRYSWFTITPDTFNSYDHMIIDNVGVGAMTEPPRPKGDMDDNGALDNFDIQPFEFALTDPTGYLTAYPSMTEAERVYRGDINDDSAFDNFDIFPFEQLLTGGPGAAVPEPSTLVLSVVGCLACAGARWRRRFRR